MSYLLDVVMRWGHIVFGVTWIGLLYYFNFIQTEYVKEADDGAKADVMAKLAPRALWWFRWAAMFTFLTGLLLIGSVMHRHGGVSLSITLGILMGTLMMLNVWLIIWPNQKIVIGLESGDKAAAGPKAGLASRTNTLLSLPMLFFMVASGHQQGMVGVWGGGGDITVSGVALLVGLAIIVITEANAIWGKMNGAMLSVKAVITSSVVLTIIMSGVVKYL